MTDRELFEECRLQLLELKDQYSNTINRPRHYSGEGDIIDLAYKENYIHHSNAFRSRMHFLLPEIDRALERIDDGTFGICEITGNKIEPKRLLAVPWTRISMMAIDTEAS
jgi:DnaK suppressor protein